MTAMARRNSHQLASKNTTTFPTRAVIRSREGGAKIARTIPAAGMTGAIRKQVHHNIRPMAMHAKAPTIRQSVCDRSLSMAFRSGGAGRASGWRFGESSAAASGGGAGSGGRGRGGGGWPAEGRP